MSSVRWKSARPFYVRLWFGDYELPVAFFAIGLVGLLGLAQWNLSPPTGLVVGENDLDFLSVAGIVAGSARQPFTLLLLVVIVNCVWRSAYRYEGNGAWRGMARTLIVAGAIGVGFISNPVWFDKVKTAYLSVPTMTLSLSGVAADMAMDIMAMDSEAGRDMAAGSAAVDDAKAQAARRLAGNEPPATTGPWVSYSQ